MSETLELERGIGDNGGPTLDVELTPPQAQLVFTKKRFPAMVAGFGSGKTAALIDRAMKMKLDYPTCNIAYYLPTYDLVRTIAFPRFAEKLDKLGFKEGKHYRLNKSDKEIIIEGGGRIIFRTMDSPERIIGYEVADSLVDELDTLKLADAKLVWEKIIARNRQKKPDGSDNTIATGTTPEGFKFVYEQWKKEPPSEEYELITASTYSNAHNLPKNYISDLRKTYPAQLISAYLMGHFVNLTSGSVYGCYDRVKNNTFEKIEPGDVLHIGLDFNVAKMAGVVHVYRDGAPHAVAELIDLYDTPAFIKTVKERYQSQGHAICVYPDASGASRKSVNASETDITLLQSAGFTVFVNASNPWVKDRVLSMNVLLEKRVYLVNAEACPHYSSALEQQVYDKNGEPDKAAGKDHVNDAAGYFIVNRFPVVKPTIGFASLGGV